MAGESMSGHYTTGCCWCGALATGARLREGKYWPSCENHRGAFVSLGELILENDRLREAAKTRRSA